MSIQTSDKVTYARLLTYLEPYKKRFILGLLASIPAACMGGAIAFAVGPLMDKLWASHNFTMLLMLPPAVLIITAIQGFFDYLSTYYTSYVGTTISQDLRTELYNHLTQMDMKFINSHTRGELLSRYYTDPSRLQEAVVTNLQTLIMESFSFLALAAVLISRSWSFALISIVIISLTAIPIALVSRKLRRLDHSSQQIMASIYDVFYESVAGFKVVLIFGLQKHQQKRFQKSLKDYFGNSMSLVRAGALLKPLLQFICSIGIALILFFGILKLQSNQMTLGDLTSFLVALLLLYKPVKNIGGVLSKVQRILAPAERVFEKLDTPPNIIESAEALTVDQFDALTFENISFGYEQDKFILKGLSFTMKAGETIALVGESGGGKSTLANLIPRFMDPQEGRILINGHDLRQLSSRSIRSLIAMVSQDTVLFNATVRENIRLGRITATDEEVEQVVDLANLRDVINNLSDGLDTVIGYRGVMLSGGQQQRVAIARALLKNAPLIVLDEATSALDNESEALVQDAMEKVMAGKSTVVIAHRLSTIRNADRILVIDKGQVAEQGTHEELLALDGLYSKLYYLQFRHDKDYLQYTNRSVLV